MVLDNQMVIEAVGDKGPKELSFDIEERNKPKVSDIICIGIVNFGGEKSF